MAKRSGPTPWAVARFGRATAIALAERIPAALHAAVGRQMDAQHASGLHTLYPFGGAWPARYEELVAHLRDVPGVRVVKPYKRPFEVVVANNVVLLPFEFAKDRTTKLEDRRVLNSLNKLAIELLAQYGPEPSHHQPTLDGLTDVVGEVDNSRPELLRGLSPDGVVIVFYAADSRTGLLRVGWGEAAIGAGSTPMWRTTEDLALHPPLALPGLFVGGPMLDDDVPVGPTPRFDSAPLPSAVISPRSGVRRSDPAFDQASAETPDLPLAHDQD